MRSSRAAIAVVLALLLATGTLNFAAEQVSTVQIKDDAPDDVKAYWEACEKYKAEVLGNLDRRLDSAKKQLAKTKKPKSAVDAVKKKVAELEEMIRIVGAPSYIAHPLIEKYEVGVIGKLASPWGTSEITISRVLDDRSAIVEAKTFYHGVGTKLAAESGPMLIRGIDTEKWVDNKPVPDGLLDEKQLWKVSKVEAGGRTILAIDRFDLAPFIAK